MFDFNNSKYFIMGILNVTHGSFYDGGKYTTIDKAIDHCQKIIDEGADIIDIGAISTKPGFDVNNVISIEEEKERIMPIVRELKNNFDIAVSIDTFRAAVADEALHLGADIINDQYSLNYDDHMAEVIKKYNCTWGEEAYVREQMQMMKEAFVDKGYPVILGEYGANWREFSNSSIQKKHDASIRLFHRTINEEAIKRGIIPYVWDINNPNRYGTGGIMCIIDRSKPAVFDQNSLDGIMEGAAAATWGGPTASIRHTVSTTSQSAGQYYTLTGLRVAADTKGLLITGGKKIIIK